MSRREAEKAIKQGQIKINGRQAKLGDRADARLDQITFRGRNLPQAEKKIYLKFYKPIGYTCTNRVFPGEKNIFQLIKRSEKLFSIGRLDKSSSGLLLLTNDGALSEKLAHPRFNHDKVYEVSLKQSGQNESISDKNGQELISKLKKGVNIGEGDGVVKAKKAQYLQNNIFIITLSEGKKRQIRRMVAILGYQVAALKRLSFAGIELGDLHSGAWQKLSEEEINKLNR